MPLVGFDLAGQNLHERGFAGAVRPGDGVAAPGKKVQVTSSKRRLAPKRMVMLLTESIALNYSVKPGASAKSKN